MVEFTIAILSFAVLLTGALYLGHIWLLRERIQREAMTEALRLSQQSGQSDVFTDKDLVNTQHRIVPYMEPGGDWSPYDNTRYDNDTFQIIRTGVPSLAFGMVSAERQATTNTVKEAQQLLGLPPTTTVRWRAWATQLGGLYGE